MTFLQKSYGEYNKVKKLVLVTTYYEGSDDNEELETVPIVSQNNNYCNVVSNSNNDSDDENQENFFDQDISKEVKVTRKFTINVKVVGAVKKLQALYRYDANKIIKQATEEKGTIENLDFLINLSMVSNNVKPKLDEPQMSN